MWKKIFFSVFLLLLVAIASGIYYAPTFASKKLYETLEKADSVSFSNLKFDFWKGSVELNDFYLNDSIGKALKIPLFVDLQSFKIAHLNIWDFYSSKTLKIDSLIVGSGTVAFRLLENEEKRSSSNSIKSLKTLEIGTVIIDSLQLNMHLDTADVEDKISGEIDFLAQNVVIPFQDLPKSSASELLIDFNNLYAQSKDGITYFTASKIALNQKKRRLLIKEFSMKQRIKRELYGRHFKSDKAHFEMDLDSVVVHEVPLELNDWITALYLPKIDVHGPIIDLYKDKRLPHPNTLKKFPVEALLDLNFPMQVDTLNIVDGELYFKETSRADGQTAKLDLTTINAKILNITSKGANESSNWTTAVGKVVFYNKLDLDFNWQFDLRKHGKAFVFEADIGSAPLTILNPFLINLANVKFRQGELLGGHLLVEGNKLNGEGKLDFYYKKMKIDVLDKKYHQKGFGLNILGGTANMLIRNNNTPDKKPKLGYCYAEPILNRTIIVYLWRLLASGMQDIIWTSKNASRAAERPNAYLK